MLVVLKVPTRAVMNVMGWSQVNMTSRYQHVPAEAFLEVGRGRGRTADLPLFRSDSTLFAMRSATDTSP
jgi:hypothetical protein